LLHAEAEVNHQALTSGYTNTAKPRRHPESTSRQLLAAPASDRAGWRIAEGEPPVTGRLVCDASLRRVIKPVRWQSPNSDRAGAAGEATGSVPLGDAA
jgi:hypothetical protein